jgi:hypothetical protein
MRHEWTDQISTHSAHILKKIVCRSMYRYVGSFSGRTYSISVLTNDSQHDLGMEHKKYKFEQELKPRKRR